MSSARPLIALHSGNPIGNSLIFHAELRDAYDPNRTCVLYLSLVKPDLYLAIGMLEGAIYS